MTQRFRRKRKRKKDGRCFGYPTALQVHSSRGGSGCFELSPRLAEAAQPGLPVRFPGHNEGTLMIGGSYGIMKVASSRFGSYSIKHR